MSAPSSIVLGDRRVSGCGQWVLITKGRLEPFIVTLATLSIVLGAALIFTDGQTLSIGSSEQANAYAKIARRAPSLASRHRWSFSSYCSGCVFITRYTQLGRNIYAVGSNQEAAATRRHQRRTRPRPRCTSFPDCSRRSRDHLVIAADRRRPNRRRRLRVGCHRLCRDRRHEPVWRRRLRWAAL